MHVLKIVAEGLTTSFRFPRLIQQMQPSYPMPPPATIYGHIASALGRWFEPEGVRFAYHFTYSARIEDLEHTIVLSAATDKLPGTNWPKALEGKVNPFTRELLFHPRLELYLNHPEWIEAFRSPRFAVVLGRSQDLFTYTQIRTVELVESERAYFEHTLLPYSTAGYTNRGYALQMPRYLDYRRGRRPTFARYFVVQDRVLSDDFLWFGEHPEQRYWIDPESRVVHEAQRGLRFLSFVGDENETERMA